VYVHAHARLRDMKAQRGARKASLLGDRDEAP
jgi:hypothetical protein